MSATKPAVKTRRKYVSETRRRQAERTRDRVVETARRLFLASGYAGTTIAAIAREARVSEETVFKAFGGKPGLVRAIWQRGLEGRGAVPAEARSDLIRSTATDPEAILDAWGRFVMELAPINAPIFLLARDAAASDPHIADLLREVDAARLERMTTNARGLLERGFVRPGIGLEEARDVLWTYSSLELYELLVMRRGWPIERYGRFVAAGMKAALLPLEGA
jgi:AcrR family transcriptional regulator